MLNSEYPVMRVDVSRESLNNVAKELDIPEFPWVQVYHQDEQFLDQKPTYGSPDEIESKLAEALKLRGVIKPAESDYGQLEIPTTTREINLKATGQTQVAKVDLMTFEGGIIYEDIREGSTEGGTEVTPVDINDMNGKSEVRPVKLTTKAETKRINMRNYETKNKEKEKVKNTKKVKQVEKAEKQVVPVTLPPVSEPIPQDIRSRSTQGVTSQATRIPKEDELKTPRSDRHRRRTNRNWRQAN